MRWVRCTGLDHAVTPDVSATLLFLSGVFRSASEPLLCSPNLCYSPSLKRYFSYTSLCTVCYCELFTQLPLSILVSWSKHNSWSKIQYKDSDLVFSWRLSWEAHKELLLELVWCVGCWFDTLITNLWGKNTFFFLLVFLEISVLILCYLKLLCTITRNVVVLSLTMLNEFTLPKKRLVWDDRIRIQQRVGIKIWKHGCWVSKRRGMELYYTVRIFWTTASF